jgi:putative transposase
MKTTVSPTPEDPSDKSLMRFAAVNWILEQHRRGYPLALCFRQGASRPWPDLSGQYYSARTLEDWYYDYQNKGFGALCGKTRNDKGRSRSISESLGQWISQRVRESPPRIALSTLYQGWLQNGEWPLCEKGQTQPPPQPPSLAAVYRYLKARGIRRQLPPEARSGARKAFETGRTNELWMADFSPGPYLAKPPQPGHPNKAGGHYQSHLCVLIDDHSRLIAHAAYYARANTAAFHDCLKHALRKRGLPYKLYTDNGKPFVSRHSKQICARLGIQLLHARPYHSWSKGKVERIIGSIQCGFESALGINTPRPEDLAGLNAQLHHWIEQHYHRRPHRSTKQTPLSRYLGALHAGEIRPLSIEDPEELEAFFHLKEQRRVRADGTIQLQGAYYEVDLSLKGLNVDVHYNPLTKERIEIFYRSTSYGVATRVDYLLNSQRHIKPIPPQSDNDGNDGNNDSDSDSDNDNGNGNGNDR